MIKSLSPYYLSVPFVSPLTSETCSKYTLNIYVWDGLKTATPTTPVYSVTKNNPTTSTGNDKINISRLVNDYINFIPAVGVATGLIDAENQRWCKTSVVYTTENILDTDVEQLENVSLVVKGYSYGMDGENVGLPINKILLEGTEFKVQRNGFFNLPILINESFASITNYDSGCLYFVLSDLYLETGVGLEESTDNGVSWSYTVVSLISPVCGFTPTTTTWFRLKSLIDNTYSNIYILTL